MLLSAPAFAELPARISLDTALKIFRAQGLDLLIADAAVTNAVGDRALAGSIPNPQLGVQAGTAIGYNANASGCDSGCQAANWSVSISDGNALEDTISGKRHLRIRVAEAALKAARLTRADAQRVLEFQLKQQYIQAVLAHDQHDFAIEAQKKAVQIFELNQVRYSAGAISEADVDKVEVAKLEADQLVATALQGLRVAKVGLAFMLGVRGSVPDFHIEPDLPKYAVPAQLSSVTPASLLQEALNNRPDLKAQHFAQQRASLAVTSANRMRVPDIAITANFFGQGYGQMALQPPTFDFGIQMTLPVFYRFKGERIKAQADLDLQTHQLSKAEAQVLNDVATAYENLVASRELVERMESRLLDRAARTRDLIFVQNQKGGASLLEYLDAQRTYIAVNQEYLQDLANYWTALFQLEEAIGADLH